MTTSDDRQTVLLTVPATAAHLSLLRAMVGYYAGRERLTIDQVDDLKMAVDEAAGQLLRRTTGDALRLELLAAEAGVVMRLRAPVSGDGDVIDRTSFAWTILQALADELDVTRDGEDVLIVLTKRLLPEAEREGDGTDVPAEGRSAG